MTIMFKDYNNTTINAFTETFSGTREEMVSYLDTLNIPASCEAIHVVDGDNIIMAKTREGIRDIENEEWLAEYQTDDE